MFFNNALVATNGVAGAQRDPAKQSLITTYCDVIDSVAEGIFRETALRQSRDALMLHLSQQSAETEKSKQAALVAIDEATRDAAKSEHRRIARELHQSVSQSFFSIVLGVHTAIEYTQLDSSKVIDPLNYVLHMAEDGLEETRALIFELRPESLTQEGLRAALRHQATALTVRHKIDIVTALSDTEPPLTIDHRETLYRVALERIQNSVKHAKASRITLHIAQPAENEVSMEIIDNSCGFDPQQSYSGHYGLVYMRERIRARLPVRPASSQIAPIATSSHAAIS